jgi:hypothetical protein
MEYLYEDYVLYGYSIKTRIDFKEVQYLRVAKIHYIYEYPEKRDRKQKRYLKPEEKAMELLFKDSSSIDVVVTGLGKSKTMKKIKRNLTQRIVQESRGYFR